MWHVLLQHEIEAFMPYQTNFIPSRPATVDQILDIVHRSCIGMLVQAGYLMGNPSRLVGGFLD
jgi:hypothetical protein